MGNEELKYVQEAFDLNWIAPLGPHVNGFEEDLQNYTGMGHAAALSSGTAAIHLALELLGVARGDEVICQSLTFSASANPIVYTGAIPVFVDSERETWNMDPVLLEEAIEDRVKKTGKQPKAIIPVHLYGMPAKMNEILEVAAKYDIPVIEDAAEALGAEIDGKKCGSFGLMNVLSFNGNKIITTSGGGALLSNDKEFVEKARFLATQARDKAPHYQHSRVGYNYRLSNVLAAIGQGQMKVLGKRLDARRSNYQKYVDYFESVMENGFEIEFQPEAAGSFSNRWLTVFRIDPAKNGGITREAIRLELEKDNIEARPVWKPMHLQPVFKGMPFYGNGVSERLFETGLCLPSGSNLTEVDFNRVFTVFNKIFG